MIVQRTLFVAVLLAPLAAAQDDRGKRVVQALDEMLQAMLAGNYAKAVQLTHPKVVQTLGGREKAIAAFRSGAESIHAETGMTPLSSTPGVPLGFWTGGPEIFSVVPVTDRFRTSRGTIVAKTHYIAVSEDSGKTWTFASVLPFQGENAGRLKEFFPHWPAGLTLPERERASPSAGR